MSEILDEAVVFCINLPGFIEYITTHRQTDDVHLKFGIDGGGEFLKVVLSVQGKENVPTSVKKSRRSFDDEIDSNKFRDSSVKKIFIIALVRNTQENYDNVSQLWTLLNISNFESTIGTDLKLANILVGIMTHASFHPCTWCYIDKDNLKFEEELRTVGNAMKNYNDWLKSGGKKIDAKKYKNCIHPPLIDTQEDRLFLDVISPPELHLMLGVVNHINNHVLQKFQEESESWARMCNV